MTGRHNVFAGAHFDRLESRRRDRDWLERQWASGRAALIPVWGHRNLLTDSGEPAPVLVPVAELPAARLADCTLLGELDGTVCLACDQGEGDNAPLGHLGRFRGLRTAGALLPEAQSALLAFAQAMVHWHRRHRFCGICGAPTQADDAGHVRRCSVDECRQSVFPRIDPAIIVLVEHDGRALLGRQPSWPEGMYSTIAGFMEPGESLEDAVRREVAEETGIVVGPIRYRSSQPWPFPSSLMVGFGAQAVTEVIELGDDELEDARWFSRERLAEGLRSGRYRVPTPVSISSRLVAEWFDAGTPGQLAALIAELQS